jgi:hypothetical protein
MLRLHIQCLFVVAQAAMRETNAALEKAREKAAHYKLEAEKAAAESGSASKQARVWLLRGQRRGHVK